MKHRKSIGLRVVLGIAGITVGLIVQVAGAFIIKVMGLEFGIFPALTVIVGFIVMGFCVYKWAING